MVFRLEVGDAFDVQVCSYVIPTPDEAIAVGGRTAGSVSSSRPNRINYSGEEAMNKPSPVNPPELRSTFVASSSMPWQRTDFDGIEMKILYKDGEGRSTILFKMAPGAVAPLHEHTALEQTFMLEGSLEDSEGSVGAGDFVWRPGGNVHVAHAPNGATTFISVFNRPNRFFDGTNFSPSPKNGGSTGVSFVGSIFDTRVRRSSLADLTRHSFKLSRLCLSI
jgi:quercetin dioxygenase-like cupin family protein